MTDDEREAEIRATRELLPIPGSERMVDFLLRRLDELRQRSLVAIDRIVPRYVAPEPDLGTMPEMIEPGTIEAGHL